MRMLDDAGPGPVAHFYASSLEAVVQLPQTPLVGVPGFFSPLCSVLNGKIRTVPVFHSSFGVIRRGQRLFGADRGNPLVDRLFVRCLQFVKVRLAHRGRMVEHRPEPVNYPGPAFTEI
jgi:hypothetical protein